MAQTIRSQTQRFTSLVLLASYVRFGATRRGRAHLDCREPRGQLLLGCSFTSRVAPSLPKRTVYFAPARRSLVDVDERAEGGELCPQPRCRAATRQPIARRCRWRNARVSFGQRALAAALQAGWVAGQKAIGAAHVARPAGAAAAQRCRVKAPAADDHEHVTGVGVDRDPCAAAALAPGHEAT